MQLPARALRPLMVSDHEAAAMLGVSRATLWRNKDQYPKPVRNGFRTLWVVKELEEFTERKIAERDAGADHA